MKQILGKLTADQFYRWRSSAMETRAFRAEAEVATLKLQLAQESAKVAMLQLTRQLDHHKAKVAARERDHLAQLTQMESEAGFSISDKMIDEVTFEVFTESGEDKVNGTGQAT